MLDYHVHLFSHDEKARDTEVTVANLSKLCAVAKKRHVAEIAVTEHLFRFKQAKPLFMKVADQVSNKDAGEFMRDYYSFHATLDFDHYTETLMRGKEMGLPLIIGTEMDFLPDQMDEVKLLLSSYPLDIILGSVHFIEGHMFDIFDAPLQIGIWEKRGLEKVCDDYLLALESLVNSDAYDVLAHLDLVKVTGRKLSGYALADFENEIVRAIVNHQNDLEKTAALTEDGQILEISDEKPNNNLTVEFSSAGWRKPIYDTYPSKSLLSKLYSAGIGITFASDAHEPMTLGYRFSDLRNIAYDIGYQSIKHFSARESYPLGIDEGVR